LQPGQDATCCTFEVPDLEAAITSIGKEGSVRSEPGWAVLHDPDGRNVLLLYSGPKMSGILVRPGHPTPINPSPPTKGLEETCR
jgi:hypothetical protein